MFSSNTSQVSSSAANYIEDVFSTYLYTGNGSTQTITNGIDLSGKGGLVWLKARSSAYSHCLTDTVQGRSKQLSSNNTLAANTAASNDGITTFNADGFSLGGANTFYNTNVNAVTFASWTFRKQAKFFDVVTYTGDGTAGRTVSHNLGSVPGCIMVKRTDDAAAWNVYHVSLGNTQYIELNGTSAAATSTTRWNNTTPTSTVFTLGTSANVNASGATYVAYLFAHDAGGFGVAGTDNVISCGSYNAGAGADITVDLGYEPQWALVKRTDTTGNWFVYDTMRGFGSVNPTTGGFGAWLYANLTDAETTSTGSSRGIYARGLDFTGQSGQYIYIAIRRGPMKTPTSGTSVFTPVQQTSQSAVTTNFPVDAIWSTQPSNGGSRYSVDRLRGGTQYLFLNDTSAEGTLDPAYGFSLDNNTGFNPNLFYPASRTIIYWNMRRAPSFMDVVCYTGTGSATTFSHNLGVVPELMIFKSRVGATNWFVYNSTVTALKYLILQSTSASLTNSTIFNNTDPTSSVFTLGTNANINGSGSNFVAYLFATCAGVSKVGSYTGTGTTKQIDCGFTGGARFVLIKRTDSTGDWYVWDSARGIVSGNDPYLLLNDNTAQVTNTDYIDTYSAGFEISSTAPAAINANGGSFIFFAVA